MVSTAPYNHVKLGPVRHTALTEIQSFTKPSGDIPAAVFPDGLLTLEQAVQTALLNNPDVAAKQWDTVAAQAVKDKISGARLPHVGMVGGYTRTLDAQRLVPGDMEGVPGSYTSNILSSGFIVSMPLYTGGRLINLEQAAEKSLKETSQRSARNRQELIFYVSSLFNTILAQDRIIESLSFSKKVLAEHVRRIDSLVTAQKAAPVDRMRTQVRLADIEQQMVKEKNLLTIQYRTLTSLMGVKDTDRKLSVKGDLDIGIPPLPDLETALASTWEKRGDFLAAQSALEAQAKKFAVAKAGFLPQVSIQGAYGGRWAAGPTTGNGEKQGDVGQIGIVVEMPLFDGGQINADIREQSAKLSAGQEQFRQLVLQVELEVETALLNLTSAGKRGEAILKSIDQADESLRIEQLKYNLGKGAIVDVLDAQASLLEVQTNYYRVLAEQHIALAQLNLAMGVQ